MPTFAQLSGQLVADGLSANSPVTALEAGGTAGSATINGLMAKVNRVFVEQTRVFGDPFGGCVRKVNDPFGVGIEIAGFKTGAMNKKRTAGPLPVGQIPLVSQVNYINWGYNEDITVYDREVNKAVFTPEDVGSYVAEKLKGAAKTTSQNHYRSWLQLLSDVVDGTRSISSKDQSDGNGNAVTYSATVTGYAGIIGTTNYVSAAPVYGSKSSITADDALGISQTLEGIASDFQYESSSSNKLAIDNFCVDKPYLFMESKTLNAMDVAFSVGASYKGFPTVNARQYMQRFADIIEIDAFPALPTNATYSAYRLGGVLIDRDAMREVIKYADVESMRDAENRATGFNFQGESIMAIWKGAPSYALLVKTS